VAVVADEQAAVLLSPCEGLFHAVGAPRRDGSHVIDVTNRTSIQPIRLSVT
jgi:hypothetical protein